MERPKYARFEHERRFLVDSVRCPKLEPATARRIEDLYVEATRLRLRCMTAADAAPVYKLCRKYGSDDAVSEPITNLYLSAGEYRLLNQLAGHRIAKWRYRTGDLLVDVFEGALAGLVIAEFEAESREAVMALSPPAWTMREVTDDPAFSGAELARLQKLPRFD
ncbi:MAG: hypothetical protein ACRCUI_01765 [Polymorphobacter sp.]